jgi:hypothetical protein
VRVSDFSRSSDAQRTRVSALVAWEDSDRPALRLFFETDSAFAQCFDPGGNAFLLAAVLTAFRDRERRLWIDGVVCPRLVEGLEAAMELLQVWYGANRRPVAIESAAGRRPSVRGPDRSGLFLTNGVDSLHALWWNRRSYPPGHPAAFRDAIYVEGLSFPEEVPTPRNLNVTRRERRAVESVAAEYGLTVIPVGTNIRMLAPEHAFVAKEALSSLLASVAHGFSRRLTSVSFAAGLNLGRLVPDGSNPMLDPNYCSSAIEIRQEDWTLDRLSKIRRIAGWKTAIENLSVCFEGPLADDRLNCGRCEKCLRSMVGLLIAGKLPEATAFPPDVTADALDRLELINHLEFLPNFWAPFVEPLKALGRDDLAGAVRRLVGRARRKILWLDERDWKGAVRRFDRRHMGGALLSAWRWQRGLRLPAGPT